MFANVLELEGGFADIPGDRGGVTFAGISSKQYPWLRDKMVQRNLDMGTVRDIYLTDYYSRIPGFRELEQRAPDLLWLLFIGAIHGSGDNHLAELIQRYLVARGDKLAIDGVFGPGTSRAVLALDDAELRALMQAIYGSVDNLAERRAKSVGIANKMDAIRARVRREHTMAKAIVKEEQASNELVASVSQRRSPRAIMVDEFIWLEVKIAGQSVFVRQD